MAHRGPDPKAAKHGRYTNTGEWTEVADQPFEGDSPELPKLTRRRRWEPLVVEWWETVRRMPHCVLWTAGDWQFALETAFMKDQYWRAFEDGEATTSAATEIRRREAQLGTTSEARRQLRIRYVPVTGSEPERDDQPETVVVVEQSTVTGPAAGGGVVRSLDERRRALTKPA